MLHIHHRPCKLPQAKIFQLLLQCRQILHSSLAPSEAQSYLVLWTSIPSQIDASQTHPLSVVTYPSGIRTIVFENLKLSNFFL